MDNSRGWIKIYRNSLDSSVRQNPEVYTIWMWMLLKANHEDKTFVFNGEDATVKKGSFISGFLSAKAENMWLTPRKWRTICTYLKTTGRVTVQTNNRFSIITICKYDEYQVGDSPSDKRATVKRQSSDSQATTNNNYKEQKNYKNEKKEDIKEKEINLVISYFAEKFRRQYRVTAARRDKLKTRLESFRIDEILQAIEVMAADPFYNGKNDRKWVADPDYFLRSDEIIDRFLAKSPTAKLPVKQGLSDLVPDVK